MLVKRIVFTDKWLDVVSRKTGMPTKEVREKCNAWFDSGHSLDYIKRILVIIALSKGKKLCFINPQGTN
jgi:hypothetical protein